MLYNLFALTSEPANRIVRFTLSAMIQKDITDHFKKIETNFETEIETHIPFDGKYKPEENEALTIENFDDIDNLAGAVLNPLGQNPITPTPEAFNSVKALFTGYADTKGVTQIIIQHFDKRKIISTNGLSIFHKSGTYDKIEGIGLTIDNKIAATLNNGCLTFQSFHIMRQIFDLSEYYRLATDTDIIEFVSQSHIHTQDQAAIIGVADTWIRRKVALVQQSSILDLVPLNEIKAVAGEFNIPLKTTTINDQEVIVLPTNKAELKTILRFLDEDYYQSPLSKIRCITNSKRPA